MKKFERNVSICITLLAVTMVFGIYTTQQECREGAKIIEKLLRHHEKYVPNSMASQQASAIMSDVIYEYTKPKFAKLRKNLDKTSKEVIDYVEKSITRELIRKITRFENSDISFPVYHQRHKEIWLQKEYPEACKRYNLDGDGIAPEIFYFHHGLRFASQKIKDYIKNKDILDCGAFIGDSVLVLKDYTNKNIFCYEFYKPCIEKFHKIMKLNNITSGYKLIPLALGENVKKTNASAESLIVCSPIDSDRNSNNNSFSMTTIDAEAEKRNFDIGFIKVDVEGYGFKVIKGAINTIKKQRPVLSLAVYHNREELFETKPFLEQHLENYVFEFHLQQFGEGDMNELILFCYPKELQ